MFPRHPPQKNKLLEPDAKIIDFRNNQFKYLALKMNGIHVEIREKLYEDPNLTGWMAATVTINDRAVSGTEVDPYAIFYSGFKASQGMI